MNPYPFGFNNPEAPFKRLLDQCLKELASQAVELRDGRLSGWAQHRHP